MKPLNSLQSLPTRERGLKFLAMVQWLILLMVAPYAGAWIEIFDDYNDVTEEESLPTRERGLKSYGVETTAGTKRRSLRGSVD